MDIVGARGAAGEPAKRLEAAKDLDVQLLDARLVCGHDHLVSAAEHAERAMREGTNVARSLAVEFMLYASGERQIADALTKMGIREDTTGFAIAIFGGEAAEEVLRSLALTRDDSVLEPSRAKLDAFGITRAELDSVPEHRQSDLVLERVALIDLRK